MVAVLVFLLIGLLQAQLWECAMAQHPDQLLNAFKNKFKWTGMACAIVRNNSLVYSKGFGVQDTKNNVPISPSSSSFLIASISKTITGVAVMMLYEQGKLSLDTSVSNYLPYAVYNPDFPNQPITVRLLMSHSSSIVDNYYDKLPDKSLYYYNQDPTMPLATFCQRMFDVNGAWYSKKSFDYGRPGTYSDYSNIGVALLGCIVEAVAQQPFDQFCNQNIFTPLGMTHTSWRLAGIPSNNRVLTYKTNNKPYTMYTFVDYPDGGLRTSVEDMSIFERMLMNWGTFGSTTLLQRASVEMMRTVQFSKLDPDQGLILYRQKMSGKYYWGHSGAEAGVSTEMFFDPDAGTGAILFMSKDAKGGYNSYVTKLLAQLNTAALTL